MVLQTIKHYLIAEWELKAGINLQEIAKNACGLINVNDVAIKFIPTYAFETSSTDRYHGIEIAEEYPLFFDTSTKRNILIDRQTYLIAHEVLHPIIKNDGWKGSFRYNVLGLPNNLDVTDAGIQDCVVMGMDDIKIDTKLSDIDPIFRRGFIETHFPDYLNDQRLVRDMLDGKFPQQYSKKEWFRYLMLRLVRRSVVSRYIKERYRDELRAQNENYIRLNSMKTQYIGVMSRLLPSQKKKLERLFEELYGISVGEPVEAKKIEGLIDDIASERIDPDPDPEGALRLY